MRRPRIAFWIVRRQFGPRWLVNWAYRRYDKYARYIDDS